MKTKIIAAVIVALFVAGMFFVLPVAAGPANAADNNDNITRIDRPLHDYYLIIIASKRGWRQWKYNYEDELLRFTVHLFTEGMNEKAAEAHTNDGWVGPATLPAGDDRIPLVGDGAFIYKSHDF